MGRLDGKVAIVTGAAKGIGRAIAVEMAKEGAKVVINYNSSEAAAQEVADEIAKFGGTTMVIQANVSVADEARGMVKKVLDNWGRVDVLVNNAGITRDKSLRKMTDEDWVSVVDNNLNGVYYCTTAVMNPMIEQKFGRIINISSYVGQGGNFGQANYGASKGGIIAFTKTAALELARYNITVNSLAPGFTLTDMLSKVPDQVQDQIKARIPMGRFGMPEEMAKAVVFLAADADYITGQQINVNGGVYM
ncbi:MAG: 3-oxoacyl-[acyl-carrier-protein] reductase [Chloroflexaceae bacterium]|jgi:acetoacetyl-CoA reductase/3-oxoacyl-[acyl-carrier protein] reductase|nr:3-oxoacyl-[acyl-carrier-protein] reductase [Chloroflexaceae bacterium]